MDEEVDVVALLARLTRTRYTRPELQQRPLPEGADPLRLETYLCARDFEVSVSRRRDRPSPKVGSIRGQLVRSRENNTCSV